MGTKILFLDIDGVVSSIRNGIVGDDFDLVALKLLEQAQRECGFEIVISSARRQHFKSAEDFLNPIKEVGVDLKLHERWKTPIGYGQLLDLLTNRGETGQIDEVAARRRYWQLHTSPSPVTKWRGVEIQQWIMDEIGDSPLSAYQLLDFLVVDDSCDMFPLDPSHFLHIPKGESICGLQVEHYDYIINYFNFQW